MLASIAETLRRFGALHIMVANAGIERPSPIHEMSLADWQSVMDVNLTGAFLSARAAAREFLRRGPVPDVSSATGKIVFTSSVHEFIPWAFQANYAASKGGIMLLMKSLAQELAPMKIRVNSIAPGPLNTRLLDEVLRPWKQDRAGPHQRLQRSALPLDQFGDPGVDEGLLLGGDRHEDRPVTGR